MAAAAARSVVAQGHFARPSRIPRISVRINNLVVVQCMKEALLVVDFQMSGQTPRVHRHRGRSISGGRELNHSLLVDRRVPNLEAVCQQMRAALVARGMTLSPTHASFLEA